MKRFVATAMMVMAILCQGEAVDDIHSMKIQTQRQMEALTMDVSIERKLTEDLFVNQDFHLALPKNNDGSGPPYPIVQAPERDLASLESCACIMEFHAEVEAAEPSHYISWILLAMKDGLVDEANIAEYIVFTGGARTDGPSVHDQTVCLDDDVYILTIVDESGEGFSKGSYTASICGNLNLSGGGLDENEQPYFEEQEILAFTVNNGMAAEVSITGESPVATPSPTPDPKSTSKCLCNLVLEIRTDSWPSDIGWILMRSENQEVVALKEFGDYKGKFMVYEETVCLDVAGGYTFGLVDSYKDGIGSPAYYKLEACDKLLAQGGGDNGYKEHAITVFEVTPTAKVKNIQTLTA